MDIEQAFETQRLRLLRVVAGLVAAVVFVSVGPVSRAYPKWFGGVIFSILVRAESAAQFLVIAHARLIAFRNGSAIDHRHIFDCVARNDADDGDEVCLVTLRKRLAALRALLENLPRHGLRLLRRAEKRMRRARRAQDRKPHPDIPPSQVVSAWRLVGCRIERPPDEARTDAAMKKTSPRYRVGGEDGWAAG